MIDHLMPDIPRLYSAIAEWLACMIFILPFKKRFSKIKTAVIMAVMLVVQSGFMVVTEDVDCFSGFLHDRSSIPYAVFHLCILCDRNNRRSIFCADRICCGRIHGIDRMAGCLLL